MSAEADRGHGPQPSVQSQPVGWGWKQGGLGISRLCPGAYLGHLGLLKESTALNISCWLCTGCPGNLHFHYVLDSSHDLQRDKSAEATLLTAHGEGLSSKRSLGREAGTAPVT